jgi:RES domain-containing protein
VLTAAAIADPAAIFVVTADDVPNPNWLVPGIPSAGQQDFGAALLAQHRFVAIPSVICRHSWNLLFDKAAAAGGYARELQEPFALDTRLHPPSDQ